MGDALRTRFTFPFGCWDFTSTHHASCTLPSFVFHLRSLTLIASLRAQDRCFPASNLEGVDQEQVGRLLFRAPPQHLALARSLVRHIMRWSLALAQHPFGPGYNVPPCSWSAGA